MSRPTLPLLLLGVLVAVWLAMGPRPSQQTPFDAARADETLREALGVIEPRPAGSAAHARARAGLVRALTALGLTPEVRTGFACDGPRCAVVHNVLAHVAGPTESVVWLVAHYDTVPASPGMADDGAGMATLLEAARISRERSPTRGLAVVFTDAEEVGLLGARALAEAGLDDVHAVVNLDARGRTGRAWLFRTTQAGASLWHTAAGLQAPPALSSLASALFDQLGYDTDLSVFDAHGVPGVDLALIGEPHGYHGPNDVIVDPDALQDLGDKATALWWALAETEVTDKGWVGHDLLGLPVRWPRVLTLPLALLALSGVLWRTSVRRLAAQQAVAQAAVSAVVLVAAAVLRGLLLALGWPLHPHGALLVGMTGALFGLAVSERFIGLPTWGGTWLGLTVLGLLAAGVLPEASPVFLLTGVVAAATGVSDRRIRALGAAFALLLWLELSLLLQSALAGSLVATAAVWLPLGWLLALVRRAHLDPRWTGGIAVVALVLGLLVSDPNAPDTRVHRQEAGAATRWSDSPTQPMGMSRAPLVFDEPRLGSWRSRDASPREEADPTGVFAGSTLTVSSPRGASRLGVRLPRNTRVSFHGIEVAHTGWVELWGAQTAEVALSSPANVDVFDVLPLSHPNGNPRRDGHRSVRFAPAREAGNER